MVRKLSLVLALITGFSSFGAFSLGLGEVSLKSYLNQPLNARIEVLTIDYSELNELTVRLASEAEFRRAGIQFSAPLYRLKFKLVRKPGKKAYIQISSSSPFKEPYLNLLLVVKWPKGKILREYALLIDPPVILPSTQRVFAQKSEPEVAPEKEAEVTKAAPKKEREFTATKTVEKTPVKKAGQAKTPVAKKPAASEKFENPFYAGEDVDPNADAKDDPTQPGNKFPRIDLGKQVDVDLAGAGSDAKSYSVKSGDTMMKIAKRVRRGNGNLTLHQTMMAIKRANPNAFIRGNVHLIKAGRKLVIPDGTTLASMSHADAIKDYRADTEVFRQGSSAPVAIAKATTNTNKTSTVAKNEVGRFEVRPPNENSKVSGRIGEENKAKDQDGSSGSDQADLEKARAIIAKDHEDLKSLRANSEKELAAQIKSKRLLQLKNSTMAQLQRSLAARDYCKKNYDRNCFAVTGYKKVELDKLKNRGKIAEIPFKQQENSQGFVASMQAKFSVWMNHLKENPMMAALVGGGVLFTLILLFLIIRQMRRSRDDFHESILDFEDEHPGDVVQNDPVSNIQQRVAAQAPPATQDSMIAPDAGASEGQSSYLSDFVVSNMDNAQSESGESDPLTEADVFYAYGKYEAAEMLIKEAMQAEPNRVDLRYKLLDIYHGAKNRESFEYEANTLHKMLGGQTDPMWDKVLEMGLELNPTNALFNGGAAVDGGLPDLGAGTEATDDFDLDFDFDDVGAGKAGADNITSGLESELAAIENDMNVKDDFANADNVVSFDMGDASELLASTENDLDPYESDSSLMSDVDEVGTKLDLAKAYIDMGDPEGARSILDEVLEEGTDQQKGEAEELMQQMVSG